MGHSTRRLMMGAAGAAGGDPTYIDDVFSTYLYRGDGQSGRAISNGIKLSNNNAGNGVTFDGNGDYLTTSSSSDYAMGTGDYTVECWVKINTGSNNYGIFQGGGLNTSYLTGPTVFYYAGSGLSFGNGAEHGTDTHPSHNQWFHIALVKNGSNITFYYNGTGVKTVSDTHNYTNQSFALGGYYSTSYLGPVSISNFRVVKGTAVYTSSFTVPTEPLENITNTKLLCCNQGSSVTAATVINGTITANGNPNITSGPFTADDGEGGMVWIKGRSIGGSSVINDTVRGAGNRISSNSNQGSASSTDFLKTFNNSGFSIGSDNDVNYNNQTFASWTFRKQKGFFDVVTYTGTGSARTVAHNLGSVPGCIMVKRTDGGSEDWVVYHRGISDILGNNPGHYYIYLNTTNGYSAAQSRFNNVAATSTEFTVGTDNGTNGNGFSYVAYIFAGGQSTADDARSVQLDGSGDWFSTSTSSDYTFGTGDFTVEHWINLTGSASGQPTILDARTTGSYTTQWVTYFDTDYTYNFYALGANRLKTSKLARNTWNHIALVRSSGVTRLYLNGTSQGAYTDTNNYSMTSIVFGANAVNFGHNTNGRLSNLRVVKGTAVYTSSFKPPTEPLKNITNTKLLCFNNSSTTGTTVGTITANGDPTAITDSPFDDPAGFKFGEEGGQNIIKCGSYKALGGTWNLNLGWEPQWILIKNDGNQNWTLVDAMRGMAWDDVSQGTGYDEQLHPNIANTENNRNICDAIPNGIRISSVEDIVNGGSQNYYYIAIRRSDGYVGKPVEDATKVFAMDVGNSSSNIPVFDSGFPVDFQFLAKPAQSGVGRYVASRLMGPREVLTNTTQVEGSATNNTFDSNVGWRKGGSDSSFMSWMFKRHAGFDVVTYTGNGLANHDIPHSLNQVPDMIWIKPTDEVLGWICGHSGLNGGVNPWHWYFYMNYPWASTDSPTWNDQAPTSTHFSVNGTGHGHNNDTKDYVAFLWSNVTGISKAGYYTGNGSTQTITTGFQPRFLWLMKADGGGSRYVFDTLRGWTSGNDYYVQLETTDPQGTADIGAPISTGFTLTSNAISNANTSKYIYYAHA